MSTDIERLAAVISEYEKDGYMAVWLSNVATEIAEAIEAAGYVHRDEIPALVRANPDLAGLEVTVPPDHAPGWPTRYYRSKKEATS